MLKLKKESSTIAFDSQNYVLTSVDYGAVSATHATAKGDGQIGERVMNATLDNRVIEIVGFIRAGSAAEMKAKKAALYQICEPRQEFQTLPDDSLCLMCRTSTTVKFYAGRLLNNDSVAQFVIDATCYDPLFSDAAARYKKIAGWNSSFTWPLEIPSTGFTFADRIDSIMALRNEGDVETGLLIHFTAAATVKNPVLTNVATGEYIKLNRALAPGETVVVNTNYGAESVTSYQGDTVMDVINDLDLDSTFLQTPVGTTEFHCAADNNLSAMTVTIYYFQKYLGV